LFSTVPGSPGSRQALRFDHSTSSSAGAARVPFQTDELYLFVKRYYDFDITDPANHGPIGFNHKVTRIWWGLGSSAEKNNIHLGYQGTEGGRTGNPRVSPENTDGALYTDGAPFAPEQWLQEEFLYRVSGPDQANGTFDYVRDGQNQWDGSFITRDAAHPNRYETLVFDQVSNGPGPGPYWTYYDDIYVDTTWTRVMVIDAENLAGATVREIQIPTSWEEDEIRFTVRVGAISDLSAAFVVVINPDGSQNVSIPIASG